MTENEPRARVGTSGWNKPQWRTNFYPPGLVQRRELEYAAERLATLEINTTFHGLPRPSSYLSWIAETPDDFIFSVKGNKSVTHDNSLMNPARSLAKFFASGVLGLGEKRGPTLWQTPPSLPFHRETVEAFLTALPHSVGEARRLAERLGNTEIDRASQDALDRPIRHCFEVRHSSFLTPAFAELLLRYDVAAVVTNSPGWPVILDVTSDFVYVRLHGSKDHYPDGYDEATLDHWAELVNGWRSGESCPDGRARDVFVYFDNPDHDGVRSPFDAMRLQEKLDGPGTARPHTIIQPSLW
jgi:uncharacterized protein YecE (DUF72 family)